MNCAVTILVARNGAFLLIPCAVFASGGGGGGFSQRESAPSLQEIKSVIDKNNYSDAIKMLKKYLKSDPGSADAYNYLGFSHRKSGHLPEAFKAYDKALALDPKHLGAHEYLGEAYLMNREPEKARMELAKLKGICGNCEEYRDLDQAVKSGRHQ
jgi:tetratricopeptide (TPR) repeat protein